MYCTVEDVSAMIKDDAKDSIIGDEYIEDAEKRNEKLDQLCTEAIQDACAEIDGYLGKRYRVPFSTAPAVVKKYAKDIAIYNLFSRQGIEENDREKTILNRYNAATKFLRDIALGIGSIGIEDAASPQSSDGFKMGSSQRLFSRDSMRGW